MTSPTKWEVSPAGAFIYEIPFRLPPGVSDVQPKLSLSYNSQSGNGLAGMGWSLSGLSVITRCPRTMASDGVRGAVNMDSNDRLCMDGQRLMLQSGTYGAEGAIYATEIYNGARIVGTTLTGTNNTRTFKVYTKAGELMEYSPFNTPANNVALQFVLSRVTDSKGNFWQVHYQMDIAQGEVYPKAVCYTGNSRLNQAPRTCVEFGYGSEAARYGAPVQRTDKSLAYMAGFAMRSNQRLSGVRTLINATATASGSTWAVSGTVVTDYRFNHVDIFNPRNMSMLVGVQECSALNSCLPNLSFVHNSVAVDALWLNRRATYWGTYNLLPGFPTPKPADFNGDGLTDFFNNSVSNPSGGLDIFLNKDGDGNFDIKTINYQQFGDGAPYSPYSGPPADQVGDFNGDGRSDLIRFYFPTNCSEGETFAGFEVWLSNGDGSFNVLPKNYFSGYSANCMPVTNIEIRDFNSDGRSDLFVNGHIIFFTADGSVASNNGVQIQADWMLNESTLKVRSFSDFNGDGKTDILKIFSNESAVVSVSNDAGGFVNLPPFSTANQGLSDSNYRFVYGDFNGDGKTDLVHFGGATAVKTWLSKGDGSFDVKDSAPGQTFNASTNGYKFHVGDFTGDGLVDMAQFLSPTQIQYWVSMGDGTFMVNEKLIYTRDDIDYSLNNYTLQVVDFNGDGKSDFSQHGYPPYFSILITRPIDKASLKINQITIGPNITGVEYGYLSGHTNYTTSGSPSAGEVFVRGAVPVVTQVKVPNGISSTASTIVYRYANGKAQTGSGRGFLGFEWMESQMTGSDAVMMPALRTTYSQHWPCLGMAVQSQVKLPSGGLREQNDSIIRVRTPASATSQTCGTAALNGQVVIPYLADSVTRQWEMTSTAQQGVELPRKRTLTTMDGYGNATQVQEQTLNADGTASGYSRTTTNTYDSNAERARQGRLIRSTVTHVKP